MEEDLLAEAEAQLPDVDGVSVDLLQAEGLPWLDAANRLIERSAALVAYEREQHAELSPSTQYRQALRTSSLLRMFVRALGVRRERPENRSANGQDAIDWESEALAGIFWTGHLVAGEILALLEAGFAVGALARWRALRELNIRATLLRHGGETVAVRFVEHEQWKERKQERLLHAHARQLQALHLSKETVQAWSALDEQLHERYGDEFFGDWGWAQEVMVAMDPAYARAVRRGTRPRGPRFTDVTRAVEESSPLRASREASYDDASSAVHGSPRSAMEEHGPLREIRRNPSPQNLAFVGMNSAYDLASLARAYVDSDAADERTRRLTMLLDALAFVTEDAWQASWEDDVAAAPDP
jgi:hypothetical protein